MEYNQHQMYTWFGKYADPFNLIDLIYSLFNINFLFCYQSTQKQVFFLSFLQTLKIQSKNFNSDDQHLVLHSLLR